MLARPLIPFSHSALGIRVPAQYLYPPKCRINIYSADFDLLGSFGSEYRHLDLSDTLMAASDGARLCVIFGLSSASKKWRYWDESNLEKIEDRFHGDLSFDGYMVEIVRMSETDIPCTDEFMWALHIAAM